MALKTRPDVSPRARHRRAHHGDLPVEPAALVDHRHPGAAQQGDRRRQRLRPRGGHPPGRRAQGGDHLRDHDAAVDRAALERAGARQALGPPRLPRPAAGARLRRSKGEEFERAFQRFKDLADKKKVVYNEDLEAIVADAVIATDDRFALRRRRDRVRHVRDADRHASSSRSTAQHARRRSSASARSTRSSRRSPTLTETKSELIRYQVNAITGGMDALGEVSVTLSEDGRRVIGHGAHTDILVASAQGLRTRAQQARVAQAPARASEPNGI